MEPQHFAGCGTSGRLHGGEFCHKKDHKSKDCPEKPARIQDW